jgi:hypothetical protein
VEINAPGVYFLHPITDASPRAYSIFFVTATPFPNDTLHYASLVGSATALIGVGMDSANANQSVDPYAINVDDNQSLYLANASVNGSFSNGESFAAINASSGSTVVLGQDQSGGVTGTVYIGNDLGQAATNGSQGISCLGCTLKDAPLVGQSGVVIQGQQYGAIEAEDFSNVTLTASPVIGLPPSAPGFGNCPSKNDAQGFSFAIFLNGQVNMTFKNGVVQCIAGTGFGQQASPNGNGSPSLVIDKTVIQNTELGIYAEAGKVTVTNSTINFNYFGVEQSKSSDGGSSGSIDLSGGGNTVVCSNNSESVYVNPFPGINVYNLTSANLAADSVAWDTSGPDYFSCNTAATCTCNLSTCTTTPGDNDMDAVEDSTQLGGVTTTNNTLSTITCN